jgi:uncharacterized repeat protein (TIGR01451 family)
MKTLMQNVMRTSWAGVAALMAVMLACTASGFAQCEQTGDFVPFQQRWTANSTGGYFFATPSTVVIDTNGNGITSATDAEDITYPVPTAIQSNRLITALSPTRQHLIVVGGDGAGCDAALRLRTYRLNQATATMTLVHEDCLPCPIFQGPFFYDTSAGPQAAFPPAVTSQRVMLIYTGTSALCSPSNQAQPSLRWYNLNQVGTAGMAQTELGLSPGVGALRVSPSGYQAFVQHDLTSNPTDSDYDMINLCPGPTFGTVISNQIGPRLDNVTGSVLTARIATATTSQVVVEAINLSNVVLYRSSVPNCCAGGGAPTGACCVNGGCVVTAQALCDGTWSQGVSCTAANCPPPPIAQVQVAMTGPAQVFQRGFIDYTITYANAGGASATNVVVTSRVPSQLTFISASNGGTYDSFSRQVTWTIGSLPAQSGPRTLTCRAQTSCSFQTIFNSDYRITSTQGSSPFSGPSVTTIIVAPTNIGSATGTVLSTPLSPLPLMPGSVVRHEMILTNTSAVPLTDTVVMGSAGNASRVSAIVSSSVGTLTTTNNSTTINWTGTLAPNQSATLIFETTITPCISASSAATRLNNGNAWTIRTECFTTLGTFPTSQSIPLTPPLQTVLRVTNTQTGIIGPLVPGNSVNQSPTQLIRVNPVLEYELVVTNATGATTPSVELALALPSNWIVNDPPFVGSAPAGFSYDGQTKTISFAGDVPAAGLPAMQFRAQPPANFTGIRTLNVERSISAALCNVSVGSHSVVSVPALTANPVLLGIDTFFSGRVWKLEPGVDPVPVPFFGVGEIWHNLHKEPNGDLWLAGLPVMMMNPDTLDAAATPGIDRFMRSQGWLESRVRDLAIDPVDGTLVFIVRSEVGTNPTPTALVRYNRATDSCTLITTDPIINPTDDHADVLIDQSGTIFIANRNVFARISRSMPTPIATGSVPIVAVPQPAYTLGATAGTLTTQRTHAAMFDCDGNIVLLHESTFVNGMNPENIVVTTRLYALSRYDDLTNTIQVLVPQVAANSDGSGPRQWPTDFSPLLPFRSDLRDSCIAQGAGGQVIVANDYYPFHSIFAIDTQTSAVTTIEPAVAHHFTSAGDIAMYHASCTRGCDDIDFNNNQVFPEDQDVIDFFNVLAGGDCSLGNTCSDIDFNNNTVFPEDADVIDFFNVLAGGTCP